MKCAFLLAMMFGFVGTQDHQVQWSQDYGRSLTAARSQHVPMLVVLENSASDAETLSPATNRVTPDEAALLRAYQLCRIDVSSDLGRKVAKVFGPSSLPYTVITDASCRRIVCRRAGQISEEEWLNTLRKHTGQSSKPGKGSVESGSSVAGSSVTRKLFSHASLMDAEQAARKNRRPLLVFVTMTGCHYCDKMKSETWTDSQVKQSVGQRFESVVANSSNDTEIVSRFGVSIFPTTLILSPEGQLMDRIDGFVPPREFQRRLASVGNSGS